MEDLSWKDEYSVGVEKLDQQHRRILALMDEIISRPAADPTVVTKIVTAMLRYAEEHFACEEELMHEYGYPEALEHEKEHRDFRTKAVQLSPNTLEADQSVTTDILDFLAKWWVLHILRSDMKYKNFFKKKFAQLAASHASR